MFYSPNFAMICTSPSLKALTTRFVLTSFTPNETQEEFIHLYNRGNLIHFVAGHEKCPTTQRPHLQCYLETKREFSARTFLQFFFKNAVEVTIRPALGTAQENFNYCTKDGDFKVFGSPSSASSPKHQVIELLQVAQTPTQLARQNPQLFLKHSAAILNFFKAKGLDYNPTSFISKKVYWFYGESGSGKTRQANKEMKLLMESDPSLRCFRMPLQQSQNCWFDGYAEHQLVLIDDLIDDLRATTLSFSNLLSILDSYEVQVPVKNSFSLWCPSHIWIITFGSPQEVFPNLAFQGHLQQLLRRLTEVRKFSQLKEFDDN
jgi:hypothetical protein